MKTQCKKSVTVGDFEFKEGEWYDTHEEIYIPWTVKVGLKKTEEWEFFAPKSLGVYNQRIFSDYFYTVEELRDQKISILLND